jgi:hypothetical protein
VDISKVKAKVNKEFGRPRIFLATVVRERERERNGLKSSFS